jgi:hypothetical protein
MKNPVELTELLLKWRAEVTQILREAEKARLRHFEIFPDEPETRTPTGDWLRQVEKAQALQNRIEELEAALSGSLPPRMKFPPPGEPTGALTDERRRELETMIDRMCDLITQFYHSAVQIGNHPFLEWTGVMNEYVRLCINALAEGIDFANANIHSRGVLPVYEFNVDYFAEKTRCIFGNTLTAQPELARVFLEKVLTDQAALELPADE